MTLVKQKIRFIQRSQIVVMAILGPPRFHDIRGNMYVSNPPYILEKDFENYPLKISFNCYFLCSLQGIDRLRINNTVKFIFIVSYSEIIFHILKFLLILCDENY